MRKISNTIILLLILTSLLSAATTGKIRGIIKDVGTGEPLAGVNVLIKGIPLGAATDLDGVYVILLVPPGTYTIEAIMVGYKTGITTGVKVMVDRTITTNFMMEESVFEGDIVEVIAKRDLVRTDVSASETTVGEEKAKEIPFASRVEDMVTMQAGVTGNGAEGSIAIRQGGSEEINVMVDGYTTADSKFNRVFFPVNQQSIKEVQILRGGYNAEYGQSRSGVINIVTKDPENELHVSLDYQYEPPGLRHAGVNRYDPSNMWEYRLYDGPNSMEPDTLYLYEGITPIQKTWKGWNKYAEELQNDGNPDNDMTAEEARDLWRWRHRPMEYGSLAGHNIDLSVSAGTDILPWNIGILFGFKNQNRPYTYTQPQKSYDERSYFLKLINKFSNSTKLTLTAINDQVNTVAWNDADNKWWNQTSLAYDGGSSDPFYPFRKPYVDRRSSLIGLKLLHVVSPTLYLEGNLSFDGNYWDSDKYSNSPSSKGRTYGGQFYYDQQSGYVPVELGVTDNVSGFKMYGGATSKDNSYSERMIANVSMVNQFHPSHELKTGFEARYTHIYESRWQELNNDPAKKFIWSADVRPIEMSAYIQDKIEFIGMIANVGLRWDYYNANTILPDVHHVLEYDTNQDILNAFVADTFPTKKPSAKNYISPRIGVSFPITVNSKVYFNYGHFVQIPTTFGMYSTAQDYELGRMYWIGNQDLTFQKSYNYELGYDQNIFNWLQFHIGAYYKDYNDKEHGISYAHANQTVVVETNLQDSFREVWGLEIEIRKSIGRFLTGYLHYNISQSSERNLWVADFITSPVITDNPNVGLNGELKGIPVPISGKMTPYGKGVVTVNFPENWGPRIGGYPILHKTKFNFGLYYTGPSLRNHPDASFREKHPDVEFYTIPYFNSNLRVSRDFKIISRLQMQLYLDISNLWVSKYRSAGTWSKEYYDDLYANGNTDKVGSEDVSNKDILRTESEVLYWGEHRTYILGIRLLF